MTKIVIDEKFMKLEILEWNEVTEAIFKVYADSKAQNNKDKAKYDDEKYPVFREESEQSIDLKENVKKDKKPELSPYMIKKMRLEKEKEDMEKKKLEKTNEKPLSETEIVKKVGSETSADLKTKKLIPRAPANTALFRNWLEERVNKTFKVKDFAEEYPYINEKSAKEIIDYQLQQGNLNQLSTDEYKLRK